MSSSLDTAPLPNVLPTFIPMNDAREEQHNMTAHRRARRALGSLTAATLAIGLPVLAHTTSAGAAPPPPADIITEPTWINGKIGKFEARFPADPAFPTRATMFVVGPQDPQQPQESGDTPHDHVMNLIPFGQPATCHVWKVVANDGPFTGRVHVRPSGLAYEVELGNGFVPLVSTQVVTDALVQGLVRLEEPPEQFPDFECWTTRQP